DQFKAVNQDLGYRGADEKLASIGRFLGAAFRSTDCVCRWGGDEFLALFQNMDSKTAAKRLDMVLTKIRSQVGVSISYGLVEVDTVGVDGELVAAIEAAERSIAKRAVTAV
ncbi:MAG: diguanylate cyclase, partial [Gammaproteobacteria bacterium]